MVEIDTNVKDDRFKQDKADISLIDLFITLGKEKKLIYGLTAFATFVSILVSLLMTPMYSAKTIIMPPQQQNSAASALASLGALAGMAGSVSGVKSQDEMYVAFMSSDGFLNILIQRFHLKERYKAKTQVDTRKKLISLVKITPEKKSGLLSIEFEDEDPKFASEVANAFVQEFGSMLDRMAVTDAQKRKVFFESQIRKVQEKLSIAEITFRQAKEKSGLQVTAVIAESGIRSSTELRSQIAVRELQLESLSRFATPQNPDIQRIASELSAQRAQLKKLEQGSGLIFENNLQLEAVKAYRDIKIQEAVLELLIKQLELARMEEAKEGPLIQIVDIATPSEIRSKPNRTLIVFVSTLAGLFVSLLLVFFKVNLHNMRETSEGLAKLEFLKKTWSWR